ncbi:MAG TPA: DUF1569 domain-containing protein [Vicinamibacterales bacterium]|nr:DUF1569 domain-containing protein [Vicinamibacterales bacterium]
MHRYLQAAHDEITRAAGSLPPEVIGRPVHGRWSIGEILEHLTLAFTANAGALEKVLASGELRARRPRLMQRLARVLVVDGGYFPRVQAPEMTRPSGAIAPERGVAAACEGLATLDGVLTRVAARFGERVAVANHPYFAGLSVAQWRKFHWRHTVHHVRQIRGQSLNFARDAKFKL